MARGISVARGMCVKAALLLFELSSNEAVWLVGMRSEGTAVPTTCPDTVIQSEHVTVAGPVASVMSFRKMLAKVG